MYIPKLCSELDCPHKMEQAAIELIGNLEETGLVVGSKPQGVAAGTIYAISNLATDPQLSSQMDDVSQPEIAEAIDISVDTVSKKWLEIRDHLCETPTTPSKDAPVTISCKR